MEKRTQISSPLLGCAVARRLRQASASQVFYPEIWRAPRFPVGRACATPWPSAAQTSTVSIEDLCASLSTRSVRVRHALVHPCVHAACGLWPPFECRRWFPLHAQCHGLCLRSRESRLRHLTERTARGAGRMTEEGLLGRLRSRRRGLLFLELQRRFELGFTVE